MNRVDSNLRLHTSDDPYHHLVDNLPIKELLDKCILLQNQIDSRPDPHSFKTESEVETSYLQKSDFVGRKLAGISNVDAPTPDDGSILEKTSNNRWQTKNPKTNPLNWYAECVADVNNAGEYLSIDSSLEVSSSTLLTTGFLDKISDFDVAPNPANDDALLWDATTNLWQPSDIKTLSTDVMEALFMSRHTAATGEHLATWSAISPDYQDKAAFDSYFSQSQMDFAVSANVAGNDKLTIFPDGFCIQTGRVYVTTEASHMHTFTKPFNEIYFVICNFEALTSTNNDSIAQLKNINTSNFTVYKQEVGLVNPLGWVIFTALGKI